LNIDRFFGFGKEIDQHRRDRTAIQDVGHVTIPRAVAAAAAAMRKQHQTLSAIGHGYVRREIRSAQRYNCGVSIHGESPWQAIPRPLLRALKLAFLQAELKPDAVENGHAPFEIPWTEAACCDQSTAISAFPLTAWARRPPTRMGVFPSNPAACWRERK
jgi:hypothetical protein